MSIESAQSRVAFNFRANHRYDGYRTDNASSFFLYTSFRGSPSRSALPTPAVNRPDRPGRI
jgi:hypothetical protein